MMHVKPYDEKFEELYDQFIDTTDTEEIIKLNSAESLEAFLRTTAKQFYEKGKMIDVAH